MAPKLGVKFSPRMIEMLARIGARITGEHGFSARLTEHGIPEEYHLVKSGMDPETKDFFLIFSKSGARIPGPVEWLGPVYEKE
jgi:hypothetical protein